MKSGEKYKAEELLKHYKFLRSSVEVEINRTFPEYSIKSISIVEFNNNTKHGSVTERVALNNLNVPYKLKQKAQVVMIIYAALSYLTSDEEYLIKERYFENKSFSIIGREVHQYRATIRKKINREILPKLIELGILKAWDIYMREGGRY